MATLYRIAHITQLLNTDEFVWKKYFSHFYAFFLDSVGIGAQKATEHAFAKSTHLPLGETEVKELIGETNLHSR
jgi:hypothetical protein